MRGSRIRSACVDNIRAPDVKITVTDDFPIILEWKDGEDHWKVLIAPRIENERDLSFYNIKRRNL